MKYLNFSEDFTELLIRGKKTATLRLGIKNYVPGEHVHVYAGNRNIGTAEILKVRTISFREISDADAKIDGFKSKDELRAALERFYGPFTEDTVFTQIIFRIVEKN